MSSLFLRSSLPVLALLAGIAGGQPESARAQPAQPAAAPNPPPGSRPAPPVLRPQTVAPLPGSLDGVPMVNDNNPELITAAGILLSTFPASGGPGGGVSVPAAHLDLPLSGRFDLFSHHVYAGRAESLDSTLWLAVVAAPRANRPVRLRLLSGSTALSQSVDPAQSAAPFLPLPPLMEQGGTPIWSGPGSRVALELLRRERSPLLPASWSLPAGRLSTLVVLPLPVRGLDPLLNGRNLQMRLESDGPVDLAVLAAFGAGSNPPAEASWSTLLAGDLSPREHAPTPKGASGPMVYSRVSGVQAGSTWRGVLTDPASPTLSVRRAPISWPIASLERGTLGTAQVQTAPLRTFYAGTAWAAHGNYGVEYDLALPLRNDTGAAVRLALALEAPLKGDTAQGGLRFRPTQGGSVMFRGSIEVSGLDGEEGRPAGRRTFHLVLRSGAQGPTLGTVTLAAGQRRDLRVRLIYPADATPPQVLSLLPLPAGDGAAARPAAGAQGAAVKQSGPPPVSRP